MRESRIAQINMEENKPDVESAMRNMVNQLGTYKRLGYKAVILIHGYGSSGTGGNIKKAVLRKLKDNSMRGIVRGYAGGEEWQSRKKEMLTMCGSLDKYDRRIACNEGVTVVILTK